MTEDTEGYLWIAHEGGFVQLRPHGETALVPWKELGISAALRDDGPGVGTGLPCGNVVSTLVEEHSLWVPVRCRLVRIDRADLDAWVASADRGNAPELKHQLQAGKAERSTGRTPATVARRFARPCLRVTTGFRVVAGQ